MSYLTNRNHYYDRMNKERGIASQLKEDLSLLNALRKSGKTDEKVLDLIKKLEEKILGLEKEMPKGHTPLFFLLASASGMWVLLFLSVFRSFYLMIPKRFPDGFSNAYLLEFRSGSLDVAHFGYQLITPAWKIVAIVLVFLAMVYFAQRTLRMSRARTLIIAAGIYQFFIFMYFHMAVVHLHQVPLFLYLG